MFVSREMSHMTTSLIGLWDGLVFVDCPFPSFVTERTAPGFAFFNSVSERLRGKGEALL